MAEIPAEGQELPISGEIPAEDATSPEEAITSEESSTEESQEVEAEPKRKGGVQKRLDELTANWREEQRRAQKLEAMLDRVLSREEQPRTEQPQAQAPSEPKLEQFETYEKYVEALADYRADLKVSAKFAELEQAQRAREAQRQRDEVAQTFQERARQFKAQAPDFEDVAYNPSLPVTDVMADAINTSEMGPQVLYWLGKNPQEAQRIAAMRNPVAVGREIGKVEVKLSLPQPRTTTKAPPPISPIDGGTGAINVDPDKMTADEWLAWRNSTMRK